MMKTAILSLAGGVAGFVLGATVASVIAAATRMSRMEGGVGAFAVVIGLFSGVLGTVLTLLALLHARGVSGAALARGTLAVIAGLAMLMAAAHWSYNHSQDHFTKKYGFVRLQFELLQPAAEGSKVQLAPIELREEDIVTEADWDAGQRSGIVRLYRLTTKRRLIIRPAAQPELTVPLVIPRDPSHASTAWSPWITPATGSGWSIRYKAIR